MSRNIIDFISDRGLVLTFREILIRIKMIINPIYVRICPFRIKGNKVVFSNFEGLGFGYDPKYIAEKLLRYNNLDIVWVVRDESITGIPVEIRKVKYKSIKYYYELSTAKVWVDDVRKTEEIRKRRGQYYLQTWHGFIPLKRIEKDAENQLSQRYINGAINDSKMIDLIPSPSESRTKLFRRSFWYQGEIIKCGCPRIDLLRRNIYKKESIYKQLHIDKEDKIVVYAPTFRSTYSLESYDIDLERLHKSLANKFGGSYRIVVRLHPAMRNKDVSAHFGHSIIDGSKLENPQELFGIADIVISDYSDSLFEAAISGAVVLIYASDIDEYTKDRSFYIDFFSLPFPIATNNEELEENINSFSFTEYNEKLNEFWHDQGLYQLQDSAEILANWIYAKTQGD